LFLDSAEDAARTDGKLNRIDPKEIEEAVKKIKYRSSTSVKIPGKITGKEYREITPAG